MSGYRFYHNPRCSKSRQALQLLTDKGIEPDIIRYLDDPPNAATFKVLIKKLGLTKAHDLLRTKETEYREAGLSPDSTNTQVIEALVRHPKLLERPILEKGNSAVIGRPPEKILQLLD